MIIRDPEALATIVIDKAFHIYRDIGPGLLENVYEGILSDRLRQTGLYVETQKMIAVQLDGKTYDNAFRETMSTHNP